MPAKSASRRICVQIRCWLKTKHLAPIGTDITTSPTEAARARLRAKVECRPKDQVIAAAAEADVLGWSLAGDYVVGASRAIVDAARPCGVIDLDEQYLVDTEALDVSCNLHCREVAGRATDVGATP